MATKKDLVEAHSFSKRRLVTAFISGAPGGREVEPVRPGRVLIGGVALSLLLLAGAAIAGFLIGRPNSQWLEAGSFVTSKDTGEQYVVLEGGDDPVIRRVPNYISAQLLLGESDLTPFQVRDKYIREVTLGEDLGIDDAPAGLPDPDGLIQDGWTACTAPDTGIQIAVDRTPAVNELHRLRVPGEQRRSLCLIAPDVAGPDGRAYRFELPQRPDRGRHRRRPARLRRHRAGARGQHRLAQPLPARRRADRGGLRRHRVGQPRRLRPTASRPTSPRYRIGDLLTTPNGESYLLADDGPQRLSEFAVHDLRRRRSRGAADRRRPRAPPFQSAEYPAEWPETLPTRRPGAGDVRGPPPRLRRHAARRARRRPDGRRLRRRDSTRVASDVEVQPAGGAYVQSGADDAATDGTPYVIDSAGLQVRAHRPRGAGLHRLRRARRRRSCPAPGWTSSTTRSTCRSTWRDACPRTPRRRTLRRGVMSRRSAAALLAAGLAGSVLPLVGAAVPARAAFGVRRRGRRSARRRCRPGRRGARRQQGADQPCRWSACTCPRRRRSPTASGVKVAGHRQRHPGRASASTGRSAVAVARACRPPCLSGHGTIVGGLISGTRRGGARRAGDRHPRLRHRRRGRVAGGEARHLAGHRRRASSRPSRCYRTHAVQGRQHLAVGRDRRPGAAAGDQGAARARRRRRGLGGQRRPDEDSETLQGHRRTTTPRSTRPTTRASSRVSAAPPPGGTALGSVVPNEDTDVAAPDPGRDLGQRQRAAVRDRCRWRPRGRPPR